MDDAQTIPRSLALALIEWARRPPDDPNEADIAVLAAIEMARADLIVASQDEPVPAKQVSADG